MSKNNLFVILALVSGAVFLSYVYFNLPQPRLALDQPGWLISPASRDTTYLKTFTITNAGRLPLKLSRLASSCFCVTASLSTTEVYPGKSAKLDISFITHDLGKVERIIYFNTNDPRHKSVRFMITAEISSVKLMFFHSPNCEKCVEISNYLFDLQKKYPLEIRQFNINDKSNYEKLIELENKYKVQKNEMPEVFIGKFALTGKRDIKNQLEEKIKIVMTEGDADWPEASEGESIVLKRFNSFSFFAVAAAGLIDGINPCAFTTIIFFISFLTFIGKGKKDILFAGISFSLAVFFTYLLIGLGAFNAIRSLGSFYFLSRIVSYGVGALAVILGVLSLYDYYSFKKGNKIILKLPVSVEKLIHSAIRTNKSSYLFITAAVSGFIISFLELICTGQVYLPTIVFIMKDSLMNTKALAYLILYNLMFILPLIIVFILAYFGVASDRFGEILKKNLGVVKILTALLFFALGIILLFTR